MPFTAGKSTIKRQKKKTKATLKYNAPTPHWQQYNERHLAFAANVACWPSTHTLATTHTHTKKKCSHSSCNPSGVPASSVFGSLRNLRTCPPPLGRQHGTPVSKATPRTRCVKKQNTSSPLPKPFHTHCFALLLYMAEQKRPPQLSHMLLPHLSRSDGRNAESGGTE